MFNLILKYSWIFHICDNLKNQKLLTRKNMLHNLEGQDCKEIKLNDQNKKRIIIYMNNVLHNAI